MRRFDVKAMAAVMLAIGLVFVAQSAFAQQYFQIVRSAISEDIEPGANEATATIDIDTDDGDRILVVFVIAESEEVEVDVVEADGVEMTEVPDTSVVEELTLVGAYYLLEEDLGSGEIDVVATLTDDSGDGVAVVAHVLQNAEQEEPVGASTFVPGDDGGLIETEVDTTADLSLVIDGVETGDGDDDLLETLFTTEDGQVRLVAGVCGSCLIASSSIVVEGPDTVTPGWEYDAENRMGHAVVIVAATAGSELPPPLGANQGPTEVPSGAPVDGGLGLALLVLGGALGGAYAIRRDRK
jgi:hypothetical protein